MYNLTYTPSRVVCCKKLQYRIKYVYNEDMKKKKNIKQLPLIKPEYINQYAVDSVIGIICTLAHPSFMLECEQRNLNDETRAYHLQAFGQWVSLLCLPLSMSLPR